MTEYTMRTRGSKLRELGLVFAICSVVLAVPLSSQTGKMPQTALLAMSQGDTIKAMALDDTGPWLAAASVDGSVSIWRASGRFELVQRIQVCADPVIALDLAGGNILACVGASPYGTYTVYVYDWKSGELLQEASVDSQVLSLRISPRTNFVSLTLARLESFAFIPIHPGETVPDFGPSLGLIQFSVMGSKEDRVVCYHSSDGLILYYDLLTSKEIFRTQTRADLENLTLIPDGQKRKVVGLAGSELDLVDLLDGKVLDRKSLPFSPIAVACDQANPGLVSVLGQANGKYSIQIYRVDQNKIGGDKAVKLNQKFAPTSFSVYNSVLFVGQNTGIVERVGLDEVKNALCDAIVDPVFGATIQNESLFISSKKGLWKISSDLFAPAETPTTRNVTRFDVSRIALDGGPFGLLNGSDKDIILWERDNNPKLYRYDTVKNVMKYSVAAGSSGFLRVNASGAGDGFYTVDATGKTTHWAFADLKPLFSFTSLGSLGVADGGGGSILIGKGARSSLDSPLIRVFERTGETLGFQTADKLIGRLQGTAGSTYYTLGVEQKDNTRTSVLRRIDIESGESEALLSVDGEFINSDLVIDSAQTLWTSLGKKSVHGIQGSSVFALDPSNHLSGDLFVGSGIVGTINQNGSISFWDGATQRFIGDLVVLASGSIIFLNSQGAVLSSKPLDAPTRALLSSPSNMSEPWYELRLPSTIIQAADSH